MEQTKIKISSLKDDIEQIIKDVQGSRTDIMRFCRDHSDPFLYYDKMPVLNITQDELLGVFDMKSNHFFLESEQIVRFAGHFKLRIPNTIALIMKAEWENIFSNQVKYSVGSGQNLESLLFDKELIEKHLDEYNPDNDKIFSMIKDVPFGPDEEKSYGQVDLIIREIIQNKGCLMENKSIDQIFPSHSISEKMMLDKSTVNQKETYFKLKDLWTLKSFELTNFLSSLESTKQENLNIEEDYLRTFREEVLEKSELVYQVEKSKVILKLINDNPELTLDELSNLAEEKMIDQKRERAELRQKLLRSSKIINENYTGASGSGVSNDFIKDYEEKCNKLLTKLFFLLHTDHCPKHARFSDKKKGEISELWMELMKIKSKEKNNSWSKGMLMYDHSDLNQLINIYYRACKILGKDPENFELGNNLEFMISIGKPIQKVIEFLQSEIKKFEYHLANLELIQVEYTNEEVSIACMNALNEGSSHSEKLKAEIAELKLQVTELEKIIAEKFNSPQNEKTEQIATEK